MSSTASPLSGSTTGAPPSAAALPLILLAQFVIPLSIAGTAVALPAVAADLGSAPGPLQWIVNGFNVSFAVFTIVWGALSDRIGYRTAFRAGTALVLVGAIASAMADRLLWLDAARVLAGVGAAAVLTGSTAILSHAYAGAARAKAFAAFGAVNGLGLAAGPALSGLLVGWFGWRGVFAAHALLLIVALAGSGALPTAARSGISVALLDFSALRHPGFAAMTLVPVAGAVSFVSVLTYLPTALQAVHGWTAAAAGLVMVVMTAPVLLAPIAVHRWMRHSSWPTPERVSALALGCGVLGALGLLTVRPGVGVGWSLLPMVLAGLSFGLPLGVVDGRALEVVPVERSGTAAGVLNLFRIGSEALAVAGFATALTALLRARLPAGQAAQAAAGQPGFASVYANALAWVLIGVAVLVALLTALFAPLARLASTRRRMPEQPSAR